PTGEVVVPESDIAAAHALYRRLFGPIADELKDARQLVVAANGPLLSLPFEMLVSEGGGLVTQGDYRAVPFLLKRFAVSYVPAPQTFVGLRRIKAASAAPRPLIRFRDFPPASRAQLAAALPPRR